MLDCEANDKCHDTPMLDCELTWFTNDLLMCLNSLTFCLLSLRGLVSVIILSS